MRCSAITHKKWSKIDQDFEKLKNNEIKAKTVFGKLCYGLLHYFLEKIQKKLCEDPYDFIHEWQDFIKITFNLNDDITTYHDIASFNSCIFKSDCKEQYLPNDICKCTKCIEPKKVYQHNYKIHEFIYGEKKVLTKNGKTFTHYKKRNNSPDFWLKHWDFPMSPFRVAQSFLKNQCMYLVDLTKSGNVLDARIYFVLQKVPKSVKVWHKNHLIPKIDKKQDYFDKIFQIDILVLETYTDLVNAICKKIY